MPATTYTTDEIDAQSAETSALIAGLTEAAAAQAARIAALEAAVFPPPAVPVPLPVCGADQAGGTWQAISDATGGLAGVRAYQAPGRLFPVSWPGTTGGPLPATATAVIASLKPDITAFLAGTLDAQLSAYAATIPPGGRLTFWHEGEKGGFNFAAADITAMHARARRLVKAANPGALYGQVYTCWSEHEDRITAWTAPDMDFYGLDGYQPDAATTVDSVFGQARDMVLAAEPAATFLIAETNSLPALDRPAWFRAAWQWAVDNHCATFFTYWDAPGTTSHAWVPGDTATIAALAAINAASKA